MKSIFFAYVKFLNLLKDNKIINLDHMFICNKGNFKFSLDCSLFSLEFPTSAIISKAHISLLRMDCFELPKNTLKIADFPNN